jgi:hypothetical protein
MIKDENKPSDKPGKKNSKSTSHDGNEFARESVVEEIKYRRDKQWKVFSWSSSILLAALGGIVAYSDKSGSPRFYPPHRSLLISVLIVLAVFAGIWLYLNIRKEEELNRKLISGNEHLETPASTKGGFRVTRVRHLFKFFGYIGTVFLIAAAAVFAVLSVNPNPSTLPPLASSWYFAVSGDSRDCGDLIMPKIAKSIVNNRNQSPIEFYWHLGDFRRIFSIDCDIAKQTDPSFPCDKRPEGETATDDYLSNAWNDFKQNQMKPFKDGQIPVFLGIGNHELYNNLSRQKFRDEFKEWLTQEPLSSQRRADSGIGITSVDGDTYYHFIKNGVDFIYLDNAEVKEGYKAYFDPRQIAWLSRVLNSDRQNDSVKTIIVGMHAALPYSKSSSHAMDASCQGICSGLQVYDLLYRAQNLGDPVRGQKRVYILASHSHYFEENIFDTLEQRARGQVLPGWIIGTAGAEQYRNEIKYGYLQVEVRSDGTINPTFRQVTRDMPPFDTGPESLTDFCFKQNTRASRDDAFTGDCPCGAASTQKP